jgi:hypothetical protein
MLKIFTEILDLPHAFNSAPSLYNFNYRQFRLESKQLQLLSTAYLRISKFLFCLCLVFSEIRHGYVLANAPGFASHRKSIHLSFTVSLSNIFSFAFSFHLFAINSFHSITCQALHPLLLLRLMIYPFILRSLCVPPHTLRFVGYTSEKHEMLLEIFPL